MDQDLSDFCVRELVRVVCGRMLGRGQHRVVYECLLNPDLVVKVEDGARSFANVIEWDCWTNHFSQVEWASEMFAPCEAISPCGAVLFQRRTTPARSYPDWVPVIWTDLKMSNFGMLDGRLVCHDYGFNMITSWGLPEKPRLRRARWWSLEDKDPPLSE